jgi:hypothetical protein
MFICFLAISCRLLGTHRTARHGSSYLSSHLRQLFLKHHLSVCVRTDSATQLLTGCGTIVEFVVVCCAYLAKSSRRACVRVERARLANLDAQKQCSKVQEIPGRCSQT